MSLNPRKIVMVGPSGVGKTTTCKRLVSGHFESQHVPTLGVSVHRLPERNVNIWDCGSGVYETLGYGYLTDASGVILVLDATDKSTFDNLAQRLQSIANICSPGTPIVVCVNKTDVRVTRYHQGLPQAKGEVDLLAAVSQVNKDSATIKVQHPVYFCEMSAKSCIGIEMMLTLLGVSMH